MNIKITNLDILNKGFEQFKTQTINTRNPNYHKFKVQLDQFDKLYKREGFRENFARNLFEFAQHMQEIGINNFPGIIYSSIAKMNFLSPQIREEYLLKGLQYSQEMGDMIHTLARIVDLKILYKKTNNNEKLFNTYLKEERLLTEICSNYSDAKESFQTYSKPHETPRRQYELRLAMSRVDIAKAYIKNNNPKKAEKLLLRARKTFERMGKINEKIFTDQLIYEINRKK